LPGTVFAQTTSFFIGLTVALIVATTLSRIAVRKVAPPEASGLRWRFPRVYLIMVSGILAHDVSYFAITYGGLAAGWHAFVGELPLLVPKLLVIAVVLMLYSLTSSKSQRE
jgi:hypothetical protein